MPNRERSRWEIFPSALHKYAYKRSQRPHTHREGKTELSMKDTKMWMKWYSRLIRDFPDLHMTA